MQFFVLFNRLNVPSSGVAWEKFTVSNTVKMVGFVESKLVVVTDNC
jgi:hypothetical protein